MLLPCLNTFPDSPIGTDFFDPVSKSTDFEKSPLMVSSQDRIPLAPQPAEDTQKKIPLSPKAKQAVAFAAFVSSLTAATLGYDVGIVAAAIEYISDSMNLNHSQTQMVVVSYYPSALP